MKATILRCTARLAAALCRAARSRSGVASTEFALMAPVFVVMTLGVIDIGNAVFHKFDLNALARIGAEYGVANSSDSDGIKTVVLNAAKRDNSTLTVESLVFCECEYQQAQSCSVSCADGSTIRKYIKVSVTEFYHPLFLPDPEKPEADKYTFFQEITHLGSEVTLRIE
ncbi:MAG TPA: TadE family protein [Vicinamibacterales bacterium]|nr:TadE family protein [Vicinamibacterales bacterium]